MFSKVIFLEVYTKMAKSCIQMKLDVFLAIIFVCNLSGNLKYNNFSIKNLLGIAKFSQP